MPAGSPGNGHAGMPAGSRDAPIDVDAQELPVYQEGDVAGAPIVLDLETNEPDPMCSICQASRLANGDYVNHRQGCCGTWFHASCLQPWMDNQTAIHGNIACPNCRRVAIA